MLKKCRITFKNQEDGDHRSKNLLGKLREDIAGLEKRIVAEIETRETEAEIQETKVVIRIE